jgi:hypothetical protein
MAALRAAAADIGPEVTAIKEAHHRRGETFTLG